MTPGIYPDLPMPDYLQLPALSAGVLRTLLDRCPAAAWHTSYLNPHRVPDFNAASDAGSISHEILFEGSSDCVCAIDPRDHPAKTTGAIPDGWKNKSIRDARDAARAAGKIPVLVDDLVTINAMVDSARRYIDGLRRTEPAIWRAFQPDGGRSEVSMLWDDGGQLCRLRSDRIATDYSVIVDGKFTNRAAEPDAWGRSQLFGMGYDMSAAFYRRGVKALTGVEPDYVFLVVECEPPYLCSLVGVDPAVLDHARSKIDHAFSIWRECVAKDEWPGYPSRVCYPELPAWEANRWLERIGEQDEHGIPYDVSKLFRKSEARA